MSSRRPFGKRSSSRSASLTLKNLSSRAHASSTGRSKSRSFSAAASVSFFETARTNFSVSRRTARLPK